MQIRTVDLLFFGFPFSFVILRPALTHGINLAVSRKYTELRMLSVSIDAQSNAHQSIMLFYCVIHVSSWVLCHWRDDPCRASNN